MEGIERLEREALELNDYNITIIIKYLRTRNDLYEKFKNEDKTISKMYDYICSKAKERKSNNNVAMVQDNLVYLWAITYFTKSNEELGIEKEKSHEVKKEDTQMTLFKEENK